MAPPLKWFNGSIINLVTQPVGQLIGPYESRFLACPKFWQNLSLLDMEIHFFVYLLFFPWNLWFFLTSTRWMKLTTNIKWNQRRSRSNY